MTLSPLWEGLLPAQFLLWLWHGFLITLSLSLLTAIAATLAGILLAIARESQWLVLRLPIIAYSALFRNTPLLVQLFFWYLAVAQLLPVSIKEWLNSGDPIILMGLSFSWPSFEFLAGWWGLTLYSTAFIAEEVRAGIRGVVSGQKQAALALGLSQWQSMHSVIVPQALRIALSPLLGQYMNILKNSSLTMAIGVAELSYASRQVETETLKTFQAFAIATLLYVLVIALMEGWGYWYQHRQLRRER